jgi:acyl-CoA synthetase (AMP-forming)/AMP-acid ligase II
MDAEQTLWQLFRQCAERHPQSTMLIDAASGAKLNYALALQIAERLAAGLFDLGIRPGDTVTWQLPTRLHTVVLTLALARLGAVQNPVIHLYRERELGAVIAQNRPAFLLVPGATDACDYPRMARTALANAGSNATLIVFDGELPQGDPARLPAPPTAADEVRWIYCTSGTTAAPKGVLHTDASLIAGGLGLATAMQATSADVGSIAFPFAHIGGLMYVALLCATGMSALLLERFVPAEVVERFRRHGVTLGGGSTAHYQALLTEQRKAPHAPLLPSLRILSGGGAPKPPELFHQVKQEMGCTVVHAYGMTESPLVVSNAITDSEWDLAYTDGVPVTGMEVRIVRRNGSEAATGEEGEIRIRGGCLCRGYLDPEQNAAAFDERGFFRTGDLGVLTSAGRLSVTGRIKDVIIRKGENISAREIEDLLAAHPKIAAVAVIGLPDAERGERVCAVVQLRDAGAAITLGEMAEYLHGKQLMRQKMPEQLEILDELPRNQALNKIVKYQLRERFSR